MEQWRNIPGYEGIYQASNIGRIRSSPNKVTSNAKYTFGKMGNVKIFLLLGLLLWHGAKDTAKI